MTRIRSIFISATLVAALCACASCEALRLDRKTIEEPIASEVKTLRRPSLAPDAVVFDALIAHVPYSERELARDLWRDADEQELEPEARRALNEQGFRVGLIGASPPESLAKLLALKGRELRSAIEEEIDPSKQESTLAPIAYSKPVNLRAGMKSAIEMRGDVVPSIPILERGADGSLCGKTYADVTPVLNVAINQVPDGSVLFDVAPLLRYGAAQTTTRYQYGQLVKAQERPTKSFDRLRFQLALRPGQFLVIGATDSNTSALGRCFFGEGGEDFEQTLLVLRLLVTQHDEQFDRFPSFEEMAKNARGDDQRDASTSTTSTVAFETPKEDDRALNADSSSAANADAESAANADAESAANADAESAANADAESAANLDDE